VSAGRRVYLAATGQNRGKTTASLGLTAAIIARGARTGFIKPVGQRYVVVAGTRADEDAVLMKEVFALPDALDDMSPVTLPRHFTTEFVMGRIDEDLEREVIDAADRVAAGKDLLLVEGTGHAGVGAVVGLSNARVAALLEAPVVIVSEGGVGRPIDEIVLNQALFERHKVRILGAIVNKVDVESHPHLPEVLRRGLAQHGIELLGCIPYSQLLANPSLELIAAHLDGTLIAGEATPGATVGRVAIGAMMPEHAAGLVGDRTLLITPGDRDDLIGMALRLNEDGGGGQVSGLILTGGLRPTAAALAALKAAALFTFLVQSDTYRAAQAVDEILVKTHPSDVDKIETIIRMVGSSLDVGDFLGRL
jgi:BioD-like phosphotransacetylase family protein